MDFTKSVFEKAVLRSSGKSFRLRAEEVLTRSFLLAEHGAFPLSVCLKSALLVSDFYFSVLLI